MAARPVAAVAARSVAAVAARSVAARSVPARSVPAQSAVRSVARPAAVAHLGDIAACASCQRPNGPTQRKLHPTSLTVSIGTVPSHPVAPPSMTRTNAAAENFYLAALRHFTSQKAREKAFIVRYAIR